MARYKGIKPKLEDPKFKLAKKRERIKTNFQGADFARLHRKVCPF